MDIYEYLYQNGFSLQTCNNFLNSVTTNLANHEDEDVMIILHAMTQVIKQLKETT